MKKYNKLGYAGALMLAGLVGFSACSSDDEVVDINPTYDGESVKTEFALAIPEGYVKNSRMTDANTQANNEFKGLKEAYVYGFQTNLTNTTNFTYTNFRLGNVNSLEATSKSTWKKDVSVPVGTKQFLVYAVGAGDEGNQHGKTIANFTQVAPSPRLGQLGEVKFTPAPIYASNTSFKQDNGGLLMAVLTGMLTTADAENAWKNTENPLLKEYYALLTNYKLALSDEAVLSLLQQIYTAATKIAATEELDQTQKNLAAAIKAAIVAEYSFAGTSTIYAQVKDADGTLSWDETTPEHQHIVPNYPTGLNLPQGVMKAKWNSSSSKYDYDFTATGVLGLDQQAHELYAYPAQLYYVANSSIKTNTKKMMSSATTDWDTFLAGNEWVAGPVKASTRSIAMVDRLNYGVGLLATSVKLNNPSQMLHGSYDGETQQTVDVTSGFTLKGIIVGGQKQVGWDFTRDVKTTGTLDNKDYFIYDNVMGGSNHDATASSTDVNYTLVYQTDGVEKVSEETNEVVNIVLELENKEVPFVGATGVRIPPHATFYLMGQLDLFKAKNANSLNNQVRVFSKDYKTIANFTIKDLSTATLTTPDLTITDMEFGMSVELTWTDGATFDVEI